jgi:hypothetical protein
MPFAHPALLQLMPLVAALRAAPASLQPHLAAHPTVSPLRDTRPLLRALLAMLPPDVQGYLPRLPDSSQLQPPAVRAGIAAHVAALREVRGRGVCLTHMAFACGLPEPLGLGC